MMVGQTLQHRSAEPPQSKPGEVGTVLSRAPRRWRRQCGAGRDETRPESVAQSGHTIAPRDPGTPIEERIRVHLRPRFDPERRAFYNRLVGGSLTA